MMAFTVFDGFLEKTKQFLTRLYEEGVIGFMAGKDPYRVRFLVSMGAVTKKDIQVVCEIMGKILKEMS